MFRLPAILTLSIAGVSNVHVKAILDNEDVILLHSIEEGPAKQSYGIYIAASAGFPEDVISVAKRKASDLENFDKSINYFL